MGDTKMNVPIRVRSHELQQLKTMLAGVHSDLQSSGLDTAAEQVERIHTTHVDGIEPTYPDGEQFAAYLSMPPEDWRMAIKYLSRARNIQPTNRVEHLQRKLLRRLTDRIDEFETGGS